MLKNYLKIALRNIFSQKLYSIINIIGLSIGISACVLITLFVKQDISYDKYHKNSSNIYRAHFSHSGSNETNYSAQSPALLGPTLKNNYPEIKNYTRVYFSKQNLVNNGNKKNYEDGIIYADSAFFEIFSYEAIAGNHAQFLKKPNTIILTESAAKKYFGNTNPYGKEIEINNEFRFEVAGVIKDVPFNSHFKFDFVITYSSLERQPEGNYLPQWGATFGSYTYVLVEDNFDVKAFEKKTRGFFKSYSDLSDEEDLRLLVYPLTEIHLNSHLPDEIEENSSISRIVILSSIALFILLLACINFINISTARSSKRAVEIGIRKTLGAFRIQLIRQFLCESIIFVMFSLLASFIIVIFLIPSFSNLVGSKIYFDITNNLSTYLIITGCVFLIGIIAGFYPAFFISSYQPAKVVKGGKSSINKRTIMLREGLVVLQFCVSIILIAGTIIINLQLSYMRDYNMGFNKDYMLILPVTNRTGPNYSTLKAELKNIPGVLSTTVCVGSPASLNDYGAECWPEGINSDKAFYIDVNSVDFDYLDHFGIKLAAGRKLSNEFRNDFTRAMVVNEKMIKNLGFKNPQDAIGKSFFITINGFKPEIVGVMKDYNIHSLHDEMIPQVLMHIPRWFSEYVVKVNSRNITSTISEIKDVWTKFYPDYPFEYHFLDESIDAMYKSEVKYFNVISTFSVIAIFIACLGLFGLSSYIIEQRRKEIGIRKVLGASIKNILRITSNEFLKPVVIANLIACPAAYYFMDKWLQNFAYRMEMSSWIFIISAGITLLIAMATVSLQVIKAATANPVEALKYE